MAKPLLSEEHVCKTVEALGHRYIGPYQSYNQPLPVECKCGCGTVLMLPYDKLLMGRGCKRVNRDNRAKAHLWTIDRVIRELQALGFTYVSGVYKGQKSPLLIKCRCGTEFYTTMSDAQHRVGCNSCAAEHAAAILRHNIEDVRATFVRYGCELLETEYRNNRQRLAFLCSCGQTSRKTVNEIIKNEGGCRHCMPERISRKQIARLAPHRQTLQEFRAKQRDYVNKRNMTNPECRICASLRQRTRSAVRFQKVAKSACTMDLIGCSPTHLRTHLESLWLSGMSWENYGGRYRIGGPMKWHIDHIRPCASFDLTDPEQQKQCFHYTNLQPMWADDNFRKGPRY